MDNKELKRNIKNKEREIIKINKQIETLRLEMMKNKTAELMSILKNLSLIERHNISVALQKEDFCNCIIIKDSPIYNDYKPSFSIGLKIQDDFVFVSAETSSLRYWEKRSLNHNVLYSITTPSEIIINKVIKLLRKGIAYRIQRLNHPQYKVNSHIALYK